MDKCVTRYVVIGKRKCVVKKIPARVILVCSLVCVLINLVSCKADLEIYTIQFNSTGGSAVASQVVSENKKATEPEEPTKLNYLHAGWYTDKTLNTKWNFNSLITENITLYAKWGINKNRLRAMVEANEDVTDVDVSHMQDMSGLFKDIESFTGIISGWDVSSVTNMSDMFLGAYSFNQDLSKWDVSSVTDMEGLFTSAETFNGNISTWDVSNVTNMKQIFFSAKVFNRDISGWDVGSVTDMSYMFDKASSFNQNISFWDVNKVTNMRSMFNSAKVFNQDISNWDVGSITDMSFMFFGAKVFNQDLSGWDITSVTDHNNFSSNTCPLYVEYHPDENWADEKDLNEPTIG